jgi:hypothetical protein
MNVDYYNPINDICNYLNEHGRRVDMDVNGPQHLTMERVRRRKGGMRAAAV